MEQTVNKTSGERALAVLSGLSSQRESPEVFCDLELEVEGRVIHVHRAVLASVSSYFDAMLGRDFKEKEQTRIKMQDVSYEGLKTVIDCIYTTKLEVTVDNIGIVLSTANMLQLDYMVDQCVQFIRERMDAQTCIKFLEIGERNNANNIIELSHKFILENFAQVSVTESYRDLPKESLLEYFADESLVATEQEIYEAIKLWFGDDKERQSDTIELMKEIRFALLDATYLSRTISTDPVVLSSPQVVTLVREAMEYHANSLTQPLYDGILNKPRSKPCIQVFPTGTYGEHWKQPIISLSKESEMCRQSQTFPTCDRGAITVCQVKNFLFVFGCTVKDMAAYTKRYDILYDSVLDLATYPPGFVPSGAVNIGEKIYCFGNQLPCKGNHEAFFEYSIPQNSWNQLETDEILKYDQNGSCAHKDFVYVSGGQYRKDGVCGEITNKFHAYNCIENAWVVKKPMIKPKCYHCLEAVGNKLYAVGGGFSEVSFEVYDIGTDQWTLLEDKMDIPGCKSACVAGEDIFYLTDTGTNNSLLCYNTRTSMLRTIKQELSIVGWEWYYFVIHASSP